MPGDLHGLDRGHASHLLGVLLELGLRFLPEGRLIDVEERVAADRDRARLFGLGRGDGRGGDRGGHCNGGERGGCGGRGRRCRGGNRRGRRREDRFRPWRWRGGHRDRCRLLLAAAYDVLVRGPLRGAHAVPEGVHDDAAVGWGAEEGFGGELIILGCC